MSLELKNTKEFFNRLPEQIRAHVALMDGDERLVLSEELRGQSDVVNLVTRLLKHGLKTFEYVPASAFDAQYSMYAMRMGMGENEIQQLAIDMISRAYNQGATDIHISNLGTYVRIRFRILGLLRDDIELDPDTGSRLIRSIYEHLGAAQDAPTFDVISRLDGRIVNRDYLPQGLHSIRIHAEPIEVEGAEGGRGTFMPLRLIHDTSGATGSFEHRLSQLGYTNHDVKLYDAQGNMRVARAQTKIFRDFTKRTGIVFIGGQTGSGKSTLLANAMKAMIEERPTDNFLSIEDPPEQPIPGMYQIPVVSKKGDERGSAYTDAIAGTNRDDTDTVMVGEIRYAEAALATIEVALSGNAVWTTIHAPDAIGIIQRLSVLLRSLVAEPLDVVCDPIVLSGLVFQRLAPKLCPHCKRPLRENPELIPKDLLTRLLRVMPQEFIFGGSHGEGIFRRGSGCDFCRESGHPGLYKQTVVAEVIKCDPTFLSMLHAKKTEDARQYWLEELRGMSYLEHARHYIAEGILGPVLAEEMLACPIDFDVPQTASCPVVFPVTDARRAA